ncbi:Na+/H+ antiporter subunit E [Demequina litorisediminis]|uniref:Na+/H+ antiporter subunit E n=1 Tax=Demequina litorisediminis TaxID=1849022 RepID=A0ABQ6IHT2_9MICO|nr:Na+/H+ antiporter subunit E [Demequina litorisediminis]GMA36721.1 Na+/H+ antiporter subunit E [Demequina litorisediminis]
MPKRDKIRAARRVRRQQIPLRLSLVVLWVFLWGTFDATTIVSGIVVAALAPLVFYLPPIETSGRLHVGWLLWFVVVLMWDIARSSITVAGQAFGIGYSPKEAIIGVKMRSSSDLILTATAEASSLVPGTLVVDVDRAGGELFIHILCVKDAAHIERARQEVLATEARLIRAVGSAADVRRVTGGVPGQRKGATR